MRKTDKFEITIDIHKKICITKKMVIIFLVSFVLLTLVVSNCSPETVTEIIRLFISIVSND